MPKPVLSTSSRPPLPRGKRPVIEPLEESEQKRQRECAPQAAADFHDSVLAIYASNKEETGNRPEHVGSCFLLANAGSTGICHQCGICDCRRTLFH
jgi:hypothetical protein